MFQLLPKKKNNVKRKLNKTVPIFLQIVPTQINIYMFGGRKMKKIDIVNLIKAHLTNDEQLFKNYSFKIAEEFEKSGDYELSKMIYGFISDAYSFTSNNYSGVSNSFLQFVPLSNVKLFLPECISKDITGIYFALQKNIGVNKFLFYGAPGTGKTEAAKLLAKKIQCDLWSVSIRDLIDSKLGETSKNIHSLFKTLNESYYDNKIIVLFDEIDSLVLNRSDPRDLREMSRATTEFFKGLDQLNENIILIATTNLYSDFDKALLRRFDKRINFSRYSNDELVELGCIFFDDIAEKINEFDYDKKLFRKILKVYSPLPFPGELKNIIKSSIAFSDPSNPNDFLSRLIESLSGEKDALDISNLNSKGFSLREIAKIISNSKSVVGRKLNYANK